MRMLQSYLLVLGYCLILTGCGGGGGGTPKVSIEDISVDAGGKASLQVALSKVSMHEVTVNYRTRDGSAVAYTNYTPQAGTLTFAPGETLHRIELVSLRTNSYKPSSKTLTVELSNAANANLGHSDAVVTIKSNATPKPTPKPTPAPKPEPLLVPAPTPTPEKTAAPTPEPTLAPELKSSPEPELPQLAFVADNTAVKEGESATFKVRLNRASSEAVSVSWITEDGNAVAGRHYKSAKGTLTFDPGDKEESITVKALTPDAFQRNDKTFSVTLSSAENATISVDTATATVTISEPDLPQLSFVAESANVDLAEDEIKNLIVKLSRSSAEEVTVTYKTKAGTALADEHYVPLENTLTFAVGETQQTIAVTANKPEAFQSNEKTFSVTLSSPEHATISDTDNIATVTISEPDLPQLSFDADKTKVKEGESVTFTVSLSRPSVEDVTGKLSITSNSVRADEDYNFIHSDSFTIAAGQTEQTIEVKTLTTGTYRVDKTFTARLSSLLEDISIKTQSEEVTVTDLVLPQLSFLASSVPVDAGAIATLRVKLSRRSLQEVTVTYKTKAGTALADEHYAPLENTLTFAVGETQQTIAVTANKPKAFQSNDKTFSVELSNATNATISVDAATVTIKPAQPVAVDLTLDIVKNKIFRFTWQDTPTANSYQLLERQDTQSELSLVDHITSNIQGHDYIVPLYARLDAEYILQSCAHENCVDSASVFTTDRIDEINASIDVKYLENMPDSGFGTAISQSDDGKTLVIGAPQEDSDAEGINGAQNNGAINAGAVFVYTRNDDLQWELETYIKASNTGKNDSFGHSISLSADGKTLAVSAINEASNAIGINGRGGAETNNKRPGAGAVYVFIRKDGTWWQQAYVKTHSKSEGRTWGLGTSVSLSGDGNTLAVGAFGSSAANDSGAAYIFVRNKDWATQIDKDAKFNLAWTQQGEFIEAGDNNHFGRRVSLSTDGNTLAVSAKGDDSSAKGIDGNENNTAAENSGAVYVYIRDKNWETNENFWTRQAYIKASNTDINDDFGYSISLSGDGNTLAVGTAKEQSNSVGIGSNENNNDADKSGAVYVFSRDIDWEDKSYTDNQSPWAQQAYIKASNAGSSDWFGNRLSLSDDGKTLAVSATEEGSNETGINQSGVFAEVNDSTCCSNSGAVYIFTRVDSKWLEKTYIKAKNPKVRDNFGKSVTLSGKGNTLVVGSEADATSDIFDKVYIY